MEINKFYIYDNNKEVFCDIFTCENSEKLHMAKRPMVIVCPGGAYAGLCVREGEPVARQYLAMGYNAAVLHYTVSGEDNKKIVFDNGLPMPLYEIAKAIHHIRVNADKYNTDPDKIVVLGFSAGGHLAGSSALLCNDKRLLSKLNLTEKEIKPNAMILIYPVITADKKYWNSVTVMNFVGSENPTKEEINFASLEKHVTKKTPPAFVVHTAEDTAVPPMNSLYLIEALSKKNVPFEYHIFPHLQHGMALANRETYPEKCAYNNRWVEFSAKWLEEILEY